MPYVNEVKMNHNGSTFTLSPGYQIKLGDNVTGSAIVTNNSNSAWQCRASIAISQAQSGTPVWRTETSWVTVLAGAQNKKLGYIPLDASSVGTYYYTVKLEVLSNSNPQITDTHLWSAEGAYTVVDEVKSITITNTNLGTGVQLDIDETTPITWTSTGDIGSYVKIEYQNIATDDGWQTLLGQATTHGQFNWTPSDNPGELSTGPYYRIRVSSVEHPEVDDESGTFGLHTKDYGVTVITHGWQTEILPGGFPEWTLEMGSAIIERAGKGSLFLYNPDDGTWEYIGNHYEILLIPGFTNVN